MDPANVDEAVVARDDQQRLLDALRGLPRRQRDCLALRYLFDLGVVEIAETLGLSPNSVKTHLKRGLASLRNQVGEEWS